jgi:hypothetical protein
MGPAEIVHAKMSYNEVAQDRDQWQNCEVSDECWSSMKDSMLFHTKCKILLAFKKSECGYI